jgi:pyrroline-5-carboxylate reductase
VAGKRGTRPWQIASGAKTMRGMSEHTPSPTASQPATIAFVGGGNMASAIIGGLIEHGQPRERLIVVEPFAPSREALQASHGLAALPAADASLARADLVVWAVKPQMFSEAAQPVAPWTKDALHLSVAAGIPSDAIARWLGTERIVRAMPNTPALVGLGMTGLFARAAVDQADCALVESALAGTGRTLWVAEEAQLDAVTALSGSGPAYVFYFLEAMAQAGQEMGLPAEQALQFAIGTFTGASELARRSPDSPATLRERVTSKGGTTFAALESLRASHVAEHFIAAMKAAQARSAELGAEFGR